ncbi:MAG TPA: DUF1559 domain-containing protein [Gemmataceae bacterium]|nr:DUF1559 domain-containing protein [Gemmataceae bacterium]
MSSVRRSGFTLIELLVVIAIIAVLIGLLVPAVQQVREAANRTTCQNNLHQMGVAAHNYLGTYKLFPPAYKTFTTNTTTPLPGWGWGTYLLPFIEQKPLFDQLAPLTNAFGGGTTNPVQATAGGSALSQTRIATYRCPSDQGADNNSIRFNHATSNYRAVAGTDAVYPPTWADRQDKGGVMFQNSTIRVEAIRDGTSNTLLIGECVYNTDITPQKWGAIWVGMTGYASTGTVVGARVSDVMWWVDASTSIINGPAPQAFGSRHTGGAFFVFCDGSVRFFRDSGPINTLRFLAGRDDGVTAGNPDN